LLAPNVVVGELVYLDDENKVVAIENWKMGFASRGGGFRVLAPDLIGFRKSDKPAIEGVYKQKGGMAPGADRQTKNILGDRQILR